MSWQTITGKNIPTLTSYLKDREWQHVNLSNRLIKSSHVFLGNIAGGRIWIKMENKNIHGVLFFSNNGVLLPAFDPDLDARDSKLLKVILSKFVQKRIFSLIGMHKTVSLIESLLETPPDDSLDYRLLTCSNALHNHQLAQETMPRLTIHRCSVSDFQQLWPLERAYQLEEVFRPKSQFHENQIKKMFFHTLQEQIVYCIKMDGMPVAKAGTNAKGWRYNQLGGVYVMPRYRNHGLGKMVVNQVIKANSQYSRESCLFVKNDNPAALNMYRSMAFDDKGSFRISYWDR